jgi:protein TonB
MMKIFLHYSLLFILISEPAFALAQKDTSVYTIVEEVPEFPKGQDAYVKFLIKETRYPKQALEKNIQGKVYVQFIVEKDGSIRYATVIRGIQGGEELEQEAIRVIKSMPKWKPGKNKGKRVRVYFVQAINFTIEDIKRKK